MEAIVLDQKKVENSSYQRGSIQRKEILERLRSKGCRITRQREILIDIILREECTCCKEIYFLAAKKIPGIGIATIYRMINALEEVGAIHRGNAYRLCCPKGVEVNTCMVELADHTMVELNEESLQRVIEKGMEACGYLRGDRIENVLVKCCS